MFRMYAREVRNGHMVREMTVCDTRKVNRTKKVLEGLDAVCNAFDLSRPIWLESTIEDFKLHSMARFNNDAFIDDIAFDYLELQVIEE
jgi:hypothetical protein